MHAEIQMGPYQQIGVCRPNVNSKLCCMIRIYRLLPGIHNENHENRQVHRYLPFYVSIPFVCACACANVHTWRCLWTKQYVKLVFGTSNIHANRMYGIKWIGWFLKSIFKLDSIKILWISWAKKNKLMLLQLLSHIDIVYVSVMLR